MWPLVKIAVVGTLALIASVWILSEQGVLSDHSKPTRPKTETPRVHSGPQLASPPPTEAKPREPQIIVRDGRLTVHVHEARLRSVLDAIAEQSGVSILDNADLGSAMVSAELRDVPIDRGLQNLLARWDVFIFYAGGQGQTVIRSVWVYPKDRGREIMPAPLVQHASIRDALPPEVLKPTASEAPDPLLAALSEPDDEARYRNLEESLNTGREVPAELLQDLLEHDPSEELRALALQGIVEEATPEKIRSIAERALADPGAEVRARAQEILERLDHLDQMDLASAQAGSSL